MPDGSFDTDYTPLGDVMHKLKYCHDFAQAGWIADCICHVLDENSIRSDLLTTVPASTPRPVQPLELLGESVSERSGIPYRGDAIRRRPGACAVPLKEVQNPKERRRLLQDAFEADAALVSGRAVLLLDDIWRSGMTARAAAMTLKRRGAEPSFVAVTRARSRR